MFGTICTMLLWNAVSFVMLLGSLEELDAGTYTPTIMRVIEILRAQSRPTTFARVPARNS